MVRITQLNQRGASPLGTVIMLGVVGYAVFVGLQYIPQKIEDMAVDSVLAGVEDIRRQHPSGSVRDVEASIDKLLNTNSREHLRNNFKVYQGGNGIEVAFSREWKLNLIYTEQAVKHQKTLILR